MPKLRDVAADRRNRRKAKNDRTIEQRVATLMSRGYNAVDAREVVSLMDGARVVGHAIRLARKLGIRYTTIEGIKDAEVIAVEELKRALAIVKRYEPDRAEFVENLIKQLDALVKGEVVGP